MPIAGRAVSQRLWSKIYNKNHGCVNTDLRIPVLIGFLKHPILGFVHTSCTNFSKRTTGVSLSKKPDFALWVIWKKEKKKKDTIAVIYTLFWFLTAADNTCSHSLTQVTRWPYFSMISNLLWFVLSTINITGAMTLSVSNQNKDANIFNVFRNMTIQTCLCASKDHIPKMITTVTLKF